MWVCQPQVSSWVFRLWRNTGSMQWQGFRGTILVTSASEHTLLCSCEHLYDIEKYDSGNNPAMTDEKMESAG